MDFAERYGPWAVVTGASEGTGAAFARRIAAAGVSPILFARREAPLHRLAEEIAKAHGVECVTAAIDLGLPDAADRVVEAVGGREVGLFIVNAGADPNGRRFLDAELDAWTALVERNVGTTMRCCHHFGRAMRARGRGGLLLVNSGACYGGARFMAGYAASKAFMLCFAEALWDELSGDGVDVLTYVLGMTDTPALRALLDEKGLPLPAGVAADPDAVALRALALLPHGPVQNWGAEEDERGFATASAAERRERVVAIGRAGARVFGE